ncbi:hypothetical protein C3747_70g77 [Trypanosoma cruzi]|uniref:Uncharacterized protein n=2 Tax=Trypanosoma cruzi TaxID=5693 RepID=Q4DAK7_TRYCC|nr:hypothetical protein, conserved [Trypanosoma cruzi]EAN89560.1 hypothetical protein, conserved [Trypanosoma cruzi]PWV10343.1 hypothetical protein C3747_70g77 [Trypanosoma cruzi]RNC61123.1 BRCT domain-containing protein [Trypanosoma cruzi]|eukprot:XP_811411.1 hypothetical protein [Trypanosoma cruzi strain CL Brener]
MASKQDRISDAMKERIIQLEKELCQCKHHLSESVQQKEALECDIDALQKEAHDVVAQWVAKSSELQTKLDESLSQIGALKNDLLISKNRNDDLQHCLKDADAANCLQVEELHRLKKAQDDHAARLAAIEKDFASASQQNIHYENLVSKMDLEMKQVVEEVNSLRKERDTLVETAAELREENCRLEAAHFKAKNFIGLLEDKLAGRQQLLHQFSYKMLLDEEERHARDEIVFQWGTLYVNVILAEAKHHIQSNSFLQTKHQELEEEINLLRKEKTLLETEFHKKSNELSSLRQEYDKTTGDLSQHVCLLEQDIAELQDAQIGQKQIVELLQKELELSTAQNELNKSLKEDLSTEFKAVKDCYSSLLLEYNELRVNEQRRQQELNAKITFLTEENKNIRAENDACFQEVMKENTNLRVYLASTERNNLEHIERGERLTVEVFQSNEWALLFSDYSARLVNWLNESNEQIWTMRKEMNLKETSLKEKEDMNCALCEKLDALEKGFSSKQNDITQLESKVVELSSELKSSKETCEETVNDNTWLKEQVETMRRELGELDELLNSNLNEMREDSERQQMEHERLIKEIHRYEDLIRQSQEKSNLLDERCHILSTDNEAISKTLLLTEDELSNAKKEIAVMHQRERVLLEEKRKIELNFIQLQKKHVTADSQTALLQEQLQTQEAKLQILGKSSRQEMENMKMKLNNFIEKYEEAEARVSAFSKSMRDSENIQCNLREAYQRAKAALEEAKQRCSKDTETIQKLLEERQNLENEREVIVQKYNRVQEMLKSLKKDSVGKFPDEIQKLSDLCFQQEVELQQLRHQNIILKKCIKKLPVTANADNQIERPVFVERLNLAEGPLRRPKKRSVLNEDTR